MKIKRMKAWWLVWLVICTTAHLEAQVPNDNFADAQELVIPDNGYALDTAKSAFIALGDANIESGEFIDSIPDSKGLNVSSAWFWFEIPTARSVRIDLIPRVYSIKPEYAGIAIYYDSEQIPGKAELTKVFPSIPRFGASINSCTKPGKYFIQVLGHKKLKDSVRIQVVTRQSPQAPVFDHPSKAKEMGTIQGISKCRFEVGCLSKDSNDVVCPDDTNNTQSAWFTFKTSGNPVMFRIRLEDIVRREYMTDYALYVLEGDCKKSLKGLPVIYSCADSTDLSCRLKANTTYSINLLLPKHLDAHAEISFMSLGMGTSLGGNRAALSHTVKLGTITQLPFEKKYTEYIDCDSRMSNYSDCLPIIMDTIMHSLHFKHHSLLTFSTLDSTVLRFDGDYFTEISGTRKEERGGIGIYRVFKGNIEDSCNLVFLGYVTKYNPLCLNPGAYTVQMIVSESLEQTHMGAEVALSMRLDSLVQQRTGIHIRPSLIEVMDTLRDTTGFIGPKQFSISGKDYFKSPDTLFKFPGRSLTGRFVFRRFYVETLGKVRISTTGSRLTRYYLFRGEADRNNLRPIHAKHGGNTFRDEVPFDTKCENLDTGWYTVVANLPVMNCLSRDHLIRSEINVAYNPVVPSNFNHANRAHLVNNLSPLSNGDSSGSYLTSRTYNLPIGYFDCAPDTPAHFPIGCRNSSQEFAYYVFTIADTSYIEISTKGATGVHLFPYNIQQDSTKFSNPVNAIDPCMGYNSYCNVPPGVYTLATTGYARGFVDIDLTLRPSLNTPNDLLSKSLDMGAISPGTNRSKKAFLGCMIGYEQTDYPISIRRDYGESITHMKRKGARYAGDQFGNIWFTFTIEEPGEVSINGISTNNSFYTQIPLVVYEAPANQTVSLDSLSLLGMLDSTEEQGLVPLQISFGNSISFNKGTCKKTRYYVLVSAIGSRNRPNDEVVLEVDFAWVPNEGSLSDSCENAKLIKLGDDDTGAQSVNIACHSIGGNYGEDGSNLSCLGRKKDIKTSWVKLKLDGANVNDLSLSLTESTTALPQEISFRVLEGTCGVMTPGHCFSEVSGGYKLDCMPNQAYYVQISAPKDAFGTIEVSASTKLTKNQTCNSLYGKGIRAEFDADMGCSSEDSIQLKITGTQGDSIRHEWIIDSNQTFHTSSAILRLSRGTVGARFHVKLVTSTLDTSETDTIEQWIYKEDGPRFYAGDTVVGSCLSSLTTKPQLNFVPDEMTWYPSHAFENDDVENAKVVLDSFGTFYFIAQAEYGECEFADTLVVINSSIKDSITKVSICQNDSFSVSHIKEGDVFYWDDNSQIGSRHFSSAGTYTLTKGESDGCLSKYVYEVAELPSFPYEVNDDLICLGQTASITYPTGEKYRFRWKSGETDSFKVIQSAGAHVVKIIDPNGCTVSDTVYIDSTNFLVAKLSDSFVCQKPLMLNPEIGGARYLWNTGDTSQTIQVHKDGTYTVKVLKEGCEFLANADIGFTSLHRLVFNDTSVCDSQIIVEKGSRPNFEYAWLNTGETGTKKTIRKSGVQRVQVKEQHCLQDYQFYAELIRYPVVNLGEDYYSCLPLMDTLTVDSAISVLWGNEATSQSIIISDTGVYHVWADNGKGCEAFDTIYVKLKDSCFDKLVVPNVFTPYNRDNKNDVFRPVLQPLEEYKMTIFNRWGQRLYESDNIEEGWNGTAQGTPCNAGVYFYTIDYKPYGEDSDKIYGSVHLIR